MTPRPDLSAGALASSWRERLSNISRNLTDFNESDDATLVRTSVDDPVSPYVGRTHAEAEKATNALRGLWQDYLALSAIVDQAHSLSRRSGFLTNRDAEVRDLLEGRSVELPSISVPVARRGLLDAAQTRSAATPAEVLASMTTAFSDLRDTVAEIAAADRSTGFRIRDARRRIADLSGWLNMTRIAIDPGVTWPGDIDRQGRDPLAASGSLDRLEADLAVTEAARDAAAQALAAIEERLRAASLGLASLCDVEARGTKARLDLAAIDLGDAEAPPAMPVTSGALADWLGTLRRISGDGRLKAADVGLSRLEASLSSALDAAGAALAAISAPMGELDDLRGCFRALRAKGVALGTGATRDHETRAKEALRRVPVSLAEAKRKVADYERALAGAVAGRATGGVRG